MYFIEFVLRIRNCFEQMVPWMDKFGLTSNSFSESFGVQASLPFSDNRGPYCESWFLGYGIDIIISTKVVNLASRQVDGQY